MAGRPSSVNPLRLYTIHENRTAKWLHKFTYNAHNSRNSAKLSTIKSIKSIAVDQSRVESREGSKVESIDRVDRQLSWIDRVARLDRFRGLPGNKVFCLYGAFCRIHETPPWRYPHGDYPLEKIWKLTLIRTTWPCPTTVSPRIVFVRMGGYPDTTNHSSTINANTPLRKFNSTSSEFTDMKQDRPPTANATARLLARCHALRQL